MNHDDLQKLAVAAALNAGLDPALVCAICEHESSWNPDAVRYEAAFFTRYISSMKGLTATEMTLRATSMGLMQVMGQVAREQGYDAPSLESLKDPLDSLTQGCRKLKKCLSLEAHEHGTYMADVSAALLRYNGGGDARYPDMVLENYPKYAHLNPERGG